MDEWRRAVDNAKAQLESTRVRLLFGTKDYGDAFQEAKVRTVFVIGTADACAERRAPGEVRIGCMAIAQ